MKLFLDRFFKGKEYTIGKLYIDGEYFCDTVEDVDRGLLQSMPLAEIKKIKVQDETAIPRGTYQITMKVQSPKYSQRNQYDFCKGYLPRLLNVPCFEGVLMHIGNSAKDSSGCILVGKNNAKGMVLESTVTFKKLYSKLKDADDKGEKIMIEIK